MSFEPRLYQDIVRDLLTTLTGGTIEEKETVEVPSEEEGSILLGKLRDRPVQRISYLKGFIQLKKDEATLTEYRFTPADFELVSSSGDPKNKDSIIFRKGGRRPAPGTTLTVNYYPLQLKPAPLTDTNVGSVVRTLIETFAREFAISYLKLDQVYKSAFLDTAEGSSLDKVVALVGVNRLPAGYPLVKVRFSRREGMPGRITLPAGTAITDAAANRYLTLIPVTLEPNETSGEVLAQGESPNTKLVNESELIFPEVVTAGIYSVTNQEPAYRLNKAETDEELRRRTRYALQRVARGTVSALRFALLSIPEVKDVIIEEQPDGVPGEIKVRVAYNHDSAGARALVQQRVDEFRPAGVRVVVETIEAIRLGIRVELHFSGAPLPGGELTGLYSQIESRLNDYLSSIAPGGSVPQTRLVASVLVDNRIMNARVVLIKDGSELEQYQLAAGTTLEIIRPFSFSPSFEQKGLPLSSKVSVYLPVRLQTGVTLEQAKAKVEGAIKQYLNSIKPDSPLSVDSLIAFVRDNAIFDIVRTETSVTVESADKRFVQLADNRGVYLPAPNEILNSELISVEPQEGTE